MRTLLDLPPSTTPYKVDVIAPEARASREQWIEQISVTNAGDGCRAREVSRAPLSTREAWPATVRRVEILDDNIVVERRLVVIYEFVHVAGAVIVRGPRSSMFDEPWLVPMLASARPDFGGEIVSLADLWR
jgi:hypothetical protein